MFVVVVFACRLGCRSDVFPRGLRGGVVCVKFSKRRSGESWAKGLRLVHKRPEGEVAAAGAPQGKQLRRWR